jgi:hypothetical protein
MSTADQLPTSEEWKTAGFLAMGRRLHISPMMWYTLCEQ